MTAAMGYNGQRLGGGPYFLHIENLPSKYTWQDLKDLIRRQASHGLWTEMAVYPNGQTGGKGYARVQRVDEACKLYRYLTENVIENRRLIVHLWDITSDPAIFVRSNSGSNAQPPSATIARMAVQPGWHTFNASSTASPPMNMPAPVQASPFAPTAAVLAPTAPIPTQEQIINAMLGLRLNPQDRSHVEQFRAMWSAQQAAQLGQQRAQYTQSPSQAPYPLYTTTTAGTPVNTTNGIVKTEARGIFVSGLNYRVRTRDIESHFGKVGDIAKVDLQKDPATGKSRGNATILYRTASEARNAVTKFDGTNFMNMTMKVRLDKETTAVAARSNLQPTIVNGSRVRGQA